MASTVKVKRSSVQDKVPLTTDLDLGEIAVNTYDGKMYIKKDDGTASVVEIGDDPKKVVPYETLSDLIAATPYTGAVAYMEGYSVVGDGGQGVFIWDSSDLSTEVTADTQKGIYVAPSFDVTGASGAWIRQHNGELNVRWFGATGAGIVDDTAAIQAVISLTNTAGISVSYLGITISVGTYNITTLDLTDYKGAFFEGAGKGKTKFAVQGTQTNAISINKGVDGSDGAINNTSIGGFYVDCTSATVSTGVYMDEFKRGILSDVEVKEAQIGFRLGYSWITRLERLTSTNHSSIGFLINGNSLNGITCDTLSATTSTATAKNYSLKANSLVMINCLSEGTPLKGFVCEDGFRKITFLGGHTEGNTSGIYSESTNVNGANLTVDGMFFYSCNTPLSMTQQTRNLTFINNNINASTTPADVSITIDAESFVYDGNVIEDANFLEEYEAVTIADHNHMDRAVVSRIGVKLEFSLYDFKFTDRSLATATSATDIETLKDVNNGSAGSIKLIQRLSGTNTSIEIALFRINEDDTLSWASSHIVGTGLISALSYNSTTKRLQLDAAYAGYAFAQIEIFRD